jgi:hypothetical protein
MAVLRDTVDERLVRSIKDEQCLWTKSATCTRLCDRRLQVQLEPQCSSAQGFTRVVPETACSLGSNCSLFPWQEQLYSRIPILDP